MKPRVLLILIAPLFILGLSQCHFSEKNNKREPVSHQELQEQFIEMNKQLLKIDSQRVVAYLERRQWDMELTPAGFWYHVYEPGEGAEIEVGDGVRYNYRIELLDGTLCYTSDSTGAKTVQVGHSGQEAGLEYGIRLLKQGDKARFIFTPYYAHGLLGDQNKIPPHSTIMYQIEVLQVEKK